MSENPDHFHLQAAYPLDLDCDDPFAPDELLRTVVGQKESYSGAGASWAGGQSVTCCPMRDVGWMFETFGEAVAAKERIDELNSNVRTRIRQDKP